MNLQCNLWTQLYGLNTKLCRSGYPCLDGQSYRTCPTSQSCTHTVPVGQSDSSHPKMATECLNLMHDGAVFRKWDEVYVVCAWLRFSHVQSVMSWKKPASTSESFFVKLDPTNTCLSLTSMDSKDEVLVPSFCLYAHLLTVSSLLLSWICFV